MAAVERVERCPSGRRGTPGERVYLHRYRGFESLPLRSACAHGAARIGVATRRGIGRWWLGPAQDGVANPARSGRKQRYRMSLCAAGHPSHHRRMPRRPAMRAARTRMTYQVLARRLRPQRFADVVGQEHVTRTLQAAIAGDRVAHAFLFAGPRGVGKTTTARILAKALNCEHGPAAGAVQRVLDVPRDRRRQRLRRSRDRRRLAHAGRQDARPDGDGRAPSHQEPLQDLHHRRGAHALVALVQRAAEDARRAAAARQVHPRDHRPAQGAADGAVALPALRSATHRPGGAHAPTWSGRSRARGPSCRRRDRADRAGGRGQPARRAVAAGAGAGGGDGAPDVAAVRALLGAADRGLVLAVADAVLAGDAAALPAAARDAPRARVRRATLLPRPAGAHPAPGRPGGDGRRHAPRRAARGGACGDHGAGRAGARRTSCSASSACCSRPTRRSASPVRTIDPQLVLEMQVLRVATLPPLLPVDEILRRLDALAGPARRRGHRRGATRTGTDAARAWRHAAVRPRRRTGDGAPRGAPARRGVACGSACSRGCDASGCRST